MRELIHKEVVSSIDMEGLLNRISGLNMQVLGDFCLDIYWHADMQQSELSRETPHYPLPIVKECFSLGGAGNVCANAAALGASVTAVGVLGNDGRAEMLKQCCVEQGIKTDSFVQEHERFTNAYCKPMRHGISEVVYEDPRLDFCTLKPICEKTEEELLYKLEQMQVDVLCVSDQLKYGCITERIRDKIIQMSEDGLLVLVDSRDRIGLYRNVYLKPNEVEGYRAVYGRNPLTGMTAEEYAKCAVKLAEKANSKVFMTLGAQGCVSAVDGQVCHVTAAKTPEPMDFVGAGDTMLAALGLALAAKATAEEAMAFANLCSSVTIGKIGVTGTASREEIFAAAEKL